MKDYEVVRPVRLHTVRKRHTEVQFSVFLILVGTFVPLSHTQSSCGCDVKLRKNY